MAKKRDDGTSAAHLDELIEQRGARGAFDFEALVTELKQALAERMLGTEMDVHLAEETERRLGNHRNGRSRKTVDTGSERLMQFVSTSKTGTSAISFSPSRSAH